MEEDSKFVPLNADDPMYGPPVSRSSQLFYTSIVACLSCEYMETLQITVYHTPICECQALLLIGFEKGETVTVISDVNLQSISIFFSFCTTITFKRTKALQ